MFCNHCGAKIADGSRFCNVCGEKIGDSTPNVKAMQEKQVPLPELQVEYASPTPEPQELTAADIGYDDADSWVCPKCKTKNAINNMFCSSCMENRPSNIINSATQTMEVSPYVTFGAKLSAAICVLVISVCILIFEIFFTNNGLIFDGEYYNEIAYNLTHINIKSHNMLKINII